MTMSDQVRQAIQRCGLTQAEIARETGISKGGLSRFMHGERDMTLRTLERIAKLISVKLIVEKPKRKGT